MREFGEVVIYTSGDGIQSELRGVFKEEHVLVDLDGASAGMSSVGPVLLIKLDDWPEPPDQTGRLEIRERHFLVDDVQDDGQGGSKLLLKRDPDG
jgi:hypothetical protein